MKSDVSLVDPLEYNLATRNAAGDMLLRVASVSPHRVAVIEKDTSRTYAELNEHSNALAHKLSEIHNDRTKPVALLMGNSYDFLVAYFGIVKAGLTVMPINFTLGPDDIQWILNDADTLTVITDDTFVSVLTTQTAQPAPTPANVIVRKTDTSDGTPGDNSHIDFHDLQSQGSAEPLELIINDDDVAQCIYTSGTTSRPKGALSKHSAVVTAAYMNANFLGVSWDNGPTPFLNILPLYHVTGLNTLVIPVLSFGGTVVLHNPFDPAECARLIEKHNVEIIMALPMMFGALLQANEQVTANISSVKTAIYAMTHMPDSVLTALQNAMPDARIILGSGQTEVLPATVHHWPSQNPEKRGSWGMPVPSVRMEIMGPDGTLLEPGQEGEIVYRGPHVTPGYWNNAQANASAFAYGWFHSGDIGYKDDDGTVWFTDRAKDIIKTGGENVSSLKVEQILLDAPGVVEVAVVAAPDSHWGETVTAVVLSDRVESADAPACVELEKEIIDYARARMSGFETPKKVKFVDALPRTSTGKIRKNVLRDSLK